MNSIPDRRSFLMLDDRPARRLGLCLPDAMRSPRTGDIRPPVIVLTASKAALPEVSGVRVVAVTCLQDLLLGLTGLPEGTPWTEWGSAPVGAGMLRRQLKARTRARRVRLVRDGGALLVEASR
tara:strand:- start:483 stop:851 length:369 start_codon:yes stop_codon:yes gene_type:complete